MFVLLTDGSKQGIWNFDIFLTIYYLTFNDLIIMYTESV